MVFDSVGTAWHRTGALLFRRGVGAGNWLLIAFVAWIASLGKVPVVFQWPVNLPDPHSWRVEHPALPFVDAWHWLSTHAVVIAFAAITAFLFFAVAGLVLIWLGSRGKLMFMAAVARGRAAVGADWAEFGALGNSLFLWRLGFGIALMLLTVAGGVFLVLMGIAAIMGALSTGLVLAAVPLILGLAGTCLAALTVLLIRVFLEDFIIPLMYRYNLRVLSAWNYFGRLLVAHFPAFVLYLLARIVLKVCAFLLVVALVIMTCCLPGLLLLIPYVGTVLILPIPVFFRCWSVCLLEALQPDSQMLQELQASVTVTPVPPNAPPAAAAPLPPTDVPPPGPDRS
ncbi:MAG: hypothetical protein A3K19_32955 [Lentisphaerae bacterium RIFOXYB12_FULL_65_16]|nr:MAG: hypothetical protein A3K18_15230 [Lentisphaerae bacterium RIFOXYA12_64_32]OGV87045.1 MAG: hypothetical protein A3K19_32955 [Lentisphaerae bacterium RIFOXYB12_FULL_65_16]